MNSLEKGIVIAIAIAIVALAFFAGKIDAGIECYEIVQKMEKGDE